MVMKLHTVKRGRKVVLGEVLDAKSKQYIQRLHENGTAVRVRLFKQLPKATYSVVTALC